MMLALLGVAQCMSVAQGSITLLRQLLQERWFAMKLKSTKTMKPQSVKLALRQTRSEQPEHKIYCASMNGAT
jgi:hypothetical protein